MSKDFNASLFEKCVPPMPSSVNADTMSAQELSEKIQKGIHDMEIGNVVDFETAFTELENAQRSR